MNRGLDSIGRNNLVVYHFQDYAEYQSDGTILREPKTIICYYATRRGIPQTTQDLSVAAMFVDVSSFLLCSMFF